MPPHSGQDTPLEASIDYEAVGLIAGLEVHQQLLTAHKLFCRCPSGLYTQDHDGIVLRHMRPTLSELGEYDGTALMEFRTRKNIVYLLNRRNVCTYEMDDTPPFLVNQEAIDISLEQCLMLGCDLVDEVHIARKQYLDGSIPTGFQRTAIVGVNGRIPFRGRTLSITQVSVEEDSCREVSDVGHLITWRTDRLGMPLIETVTGPDLRTPDEVEEAILLIGRVCRSTRHVRVGMGASRQDVNVSVRGGHRVEIKGVPRAGWAPGLVHGEGVRQVELLRLRGVLRGLGLAKPADVRVKSEVVTDEVRFSECPFLRADGWNRWAQEEARRPGMETGEGPFTVRAVRLRGVLGILDHPTQPGRTFAHELQGRVRVISGLDQAPYLLHDRAWHDFPGGEAERGRLRRLLGCDDDDALVLVWGPERDTVTAAEEIEKRLCEATEGIPPETRQPFADGHTDFERILPGPDRMYPDTDSPPTRITRDRVARLSSGLARPPWEREARYRAAGVPKTTIHYLIRRGGADLVDEVAPGEGPPKTPAETARVRRAAFFFGERVKGWRRRGLAVDTLTRARWGELWEALEAHPLAWDAAWRLVRVLVEEPLASPAGVFARLGLGAAPKGWCHEVEVALESRRGEAEGLTTRERRRWHLGQALRALRGRVPIGEVDATIGRLLGDDA